MKQTKMKKTKNIAIVLLLSLSLLMGGNFQPASAVDLDRLSNYSVHLKITPDHIGEGSESQSVGYVYILNKNGVSLTTSNDVDIMLTSDNSSIASVPEKITLPAGAEYTKFDIIGGQNGKTTITATINDKESFDNIRIGTDKTYLPDDLMLELNIPTNQMHVNSEMPFSVFLKTSDGNVIRAPYDIEFILDYEKSLAVPNNDKLTIKEGEYYAWGTLSTHAKVGNAFLRVIQADLQLDTAKSVTISSTLPAALNIDIYPYLVPAEIDRTVDIFVSLVDSNGEPTVASKDIPLKFFSNNQAYMGDDLDDSMKELPMVIKKGEFGYHFKQGFDFIGLVSNDLMIGVSSAGLGVATDTFQTVGESISIENNRLFDASLLTSDKTVSTSDNKVIQIFGPDKIPSNTTAIFAYQMTIEEEDDDDNPEMDDDFVEVDLDDLMEAQDEKEVERREGMNTQNSNSDDGDSEGSSEDEDENVLILTIDNIVSGNLYPIQANEDYRSTGLVQLLDVISEDDTIATVKNPGNIGPSYSYGTAAIESAQKSGEVLISANIKGVGSGSFRTEVVNSLEQKQIKIFSPTGKESILINRDGSFDVFLVALDASDRPKTLDTDKRYLVTPTNGIVDLEKNTTYSLTTLQSESFSLEDDGGVVLKVDPIGEEADLSLESTSIFQTQLSSQIKVLFPLEKLDINKENHVGVIQLVDLQGNPIESFRDIRAKISSSDESIVKTIEDAVIKKGESFAEFPLETTEMLGSATISASSRGAVGTESEINTATSSSSLSIFTSGLVEPMPVNEEVQVRIFVDDDTADSVAGATVKIMPNANATTTTDLVRTGADGSATFGLTATNGPEISIDFIATAEGYQDGDDTLEIVVDTPKEGLSVAEVSLPPELVYIIIGGIVVVIIVVVMFLKKSKDTLEEEEEPWEDEDI